MYRLWLTVIAGLAVWPLTSQAATQDNFIARTTADLVALCAADQADPMRVAAIHFCEGFITGVNQLYRSTQAGAGAPHIYCLPNPPPTRNDAVAMFLTWAQRNATYMSDPPVDSLMRFAGETWPCSR